MDDELNNPHIISEEQLNAHNSDNLNNHFSNHDNDADYNNYNDNKENTENNESYKNNESNESYENNENNESYKNNENNETNIYNSVPDLKSKIRKYAFLKSFNGIIILTGIIIALFIMFKFLYFNELAQKRNNKTGKANGYKNKIINYKKRFSSHMFNFSSRNKTNKLTVRKGKFSKKFYREMELLKQLKNNKELQNKNSPDKKNLVHINKKIVIFVKPSYARLILDNEKNLKKNKLFRSKIRISNFNLYKKNGEVKINYKNVQKNSIIAAIPIGTVVNCYIKYKVFSYNTEVPVIAILSNTYYYKNKQFLKKGDKFFGMVSVKHSINRLNIHFNRIIKTNGSSLNINAIAMMPDGSGGVKGDVHHHYETNALTSLAQGVVGAAAMFAGGGSAANSSEPYTFQDQIRQNVAQNELNQAQNGLDSMASSAQQTTITLPEGTPIKIIFLRAVYIK
jgi:hypothetical protein